jgi:hypothetical protein
LKLHSDTQHRIAHERQYSFFRARKERFDLRAYCVLFHCGAPKGGRAGCKKTENKDETWKTISAAAVLKAQRSFLLAQYLRRITQTIAEIEFTNIFGAQKIPRVSVSDQVALT